MKKKVLICPSDRAGVGYHRSINPAVYLEEYYGNEFEVSIDYEPKYNNEEYLKQFDIIHYHRQFGPFEEMEQTLNRLDALGVKSIMDIDDHWSVGMHHPMYLIIKNAEFDKKVLNNIKLSRNITTTTEVFANVIRKYNKNVFILPNALTTQEKQFISKPTESEKLRIGWLGSSSHEEDLKLLDGMVSKLKTLNLIDKVQFVLCGFDLRGFISMINPITKEESRRPIKPEESVWFRYEKILTDNYSILDDDYVKWLKEFKKDEEYPNVENLPYRRVWTKSYKEYATNYNHFDVLLAPLAVNDFNKVKSQLKVIEASFMGKAIIASDIEPYRIDLINCLDKGGVFNDKGNSLIVEQQKNHKGWFKSIKFLLENPDKLEIIRENLKNDVMEKYSLETVSKTRCELYNKLLND
jgi:glycosyltransferase involved in cell wall biosynthesis